MKIAIIDYDMGNVKSVSNALELLKVDHILTRDVEALSEADGLILPGVGAFGDGMKHLKDYNLLDPLKEEVLQKKKPFLGICVGMQLMADGGDEFGSHDGLGFVPGWVRLFEPKGKDYKIPHIGWNNLNIQKRDPLFEDVEEPSDYYFVHSYVFEAENDNDVSATCDYGKPFVAAVQKDNVMGVQFHPEKSQKNGISLIKNFVNFVDAC